MADVSLDDIIKNKSKLQVKRNNMKGRGGIRKNNPRSGIRSNESSRGGGGGGGGVQKIVDARMKIIQKNRAKLTDARDKLAEIAKQSDARLKLEKLRLSNQKKPAIMTGITRKSGRNGRLALMTNKIPPLMSTPIRNFNSNNYKRNSGYRQQNDTQPQHQQQQQRRHHQPQLQQQQQQSQHYSSIDNMSMDYNDDYLIDSAPLRRTVNNEYAPNPMPPPPVFTVKTSSNNYSSWGNQSSQSNRNIAPPQQRKPEIHREFKVISRAPLTPKPYSEWPFETKARKIIIEDDEDDYYERDRRHVGVKSRLEASMNKSRPAPMLSRPKVNNSSMSGTITTQTTGYRIVVSNLQANVTQEDIKELFEDVGELLVSRLVRPGTAEVIYKTLKDATKAVETYHNRQLDGHPMKCLLVNPRPKNNPTAPAVRPISDPRRATSSSYVQPSLGAVHRALFDDCHN